MAERPDCEVHTPAEVGPLSIPSYANDPDMLVLDLDAVSAPGHRYVDILLRRNPSIAVVAVCSNASPTQEVLPSQFSLDDLVVRQDGKTADRLLQKIEDLDRIISVQKKLQLQMNESRLIANSRQMRDVVQTLPYIASAHSTVLLTGETGTGKELIARAIHYLGPRAGRPFVTVDCGSMPEALIENELFGHVRGAYTDAGTAARGLIQEAEAGTLFLDEVEALPLTVQGKLLRFLQERQIKPLGQSKYSPVDVRIVAATNVDLRQFVDRKQFRDDLYYRLNVVPLSLPPLRDRKPDIRALVRYFIGHYRRKSAEEIAIPEPIMEEWLRYDWPGNVRELENRVQEWLTIPASPMLTPESLESASGVLPPLAEVRHQSLSKSERTYFHSLMTITRGNISSGARMAQVDRKSLRALLKKYGIDPKSFRP